MAFLGSVAGGLVPTLLVSRVLLWLTRGWDGGIQRVLVVHAVSFLIVLLVAGMGMADGGAFAPLLAAQTYALPQGVWLVIDLIRHARKREERAATGTDAASTSSVSAESALPPTRAETSKPAGREGGGDSAVLIGTAVIALVVGAPLIWWLADAASQTRPLSRAEYEEMSSEELASLPIERVWSAMGSDETPFTLPELYRVLRLNLAVLHYPIDLRTPTAALTGGERSQISEFQRKIGATATGSLTMTEFNQLGRFAALERMTELTPGVMLSVNEYLSGSISAQGSWSMDDIAFPLNFVSIHCERREEICEMTTIDIGAPDFRQRALPTSDYQLHLDTASFYIDRWSDGVVEARSGGGLTRCRETRLTLNTRTETVYQTTQDLDPNGCELWNGERLPRLTTPRVATLISSWDARQHYFDNIREQLRNVYGSVAPPPEIRTH